MPDTLGDRMKCYENAYRVYLTKRIPVIVRVDGRAFHTFTRGFNKPFDSVFGKTMIDTTVALCKAVEGCKLAYTQSDEISLVLTNDDAIDTQAWFGNNLQKIVSLTASIATVAFNKAYAMYAQIYDLPVSIDFMSEERQQCYHKVYQTYFTRINTATFDSRAFLLPKDEVANYFCWRQQDASRNSIQMVAQSLYSHNELHGKNTNALHELLMDKGVNWNDFPTSNKRGVCVVKRERMIGDIARKEWIVDEDIPIFSQVKEYIQNEITTVEEKDGKQKL